MTTMLLVTTGGDYETANKFESVKSCWEQLMSMQGSDSSVPVKTMTGLNGVLGKDCKILFISTMDDYREVKAKVEQEVKAAGAGGTPASMRILVNRERDEVITKFLTESGAEIAGLSMPAEEYVRTIVQQLPNSVMDAIITAKENFQ